MLQVSRSFASVHIIYTGGTISCLPTNQLEIPECTPPEKTHRWFTWKWIFLPILPLENPEIPAEITLFRFYVKFPEGNL